MKKAFMLVLPFLLACIPLSASPSQIPDTAVVDHFIAKQATQENGEEYRDARKMLLGDVNHDRVPDFAVLYTIESQNGTNNYLQYLAVFVRT